MEQSTITNMYPINGIKAVPLGEVKKMPHLKTSGIYLIVSPSCKMYIGKSINIFNRILSYCKGNFKSQHKLCNSFKKYGVKQHQFIVVEFCKSERLNAVERYYISFYSTMTGAHGLNLRTGGEGGGKWSEELRLRMKNVFKGTRSGEMNANFGKRHPGKKGTPVSQAHKDKLRECRSKPVMQYDINGMFIKEWESAKQAVLETKIWRVSDCAAGNRPHAGGFIWKYKSSMQ